MAKYSDNLGYVMPSVENPPGIWKPSEVTEKKARGDILNASVGLTSGDKLVDDITINNKLSIVMDPFINGNLERLKYVCMYGTRWEIKSISINRPRVILTIGGVYNGEIPTN